MYLFTELVCPLKYCHTLPNYSNVFFVIRIVVLQERRYAWYGSKFSLNITEVVICYNEISIILVVKSSLFIFFAGRGSRIRVSAPTVQI